jgi:hypothetical protein
MAFAYERTARRATALRGRFVHITTTDVNREEDASLSTGHHSWDVWVPQAITFSKAKENETVEREAYRCECLP